MKMQKIHLVVGLGNPGKKYYSTRHNLGFLAIDGYFQHVHTQSAGEKSHAFSLEKKFESKIAILDQGEKTVLLAKPQTFMNLSGQAVQKILSYYKLPLTNLLIIHDDFDLPIGRIRFSNNASAAGHNGVQSIIDSLGTKEFTRLRLGAAPDSLPIGGKKIPAADLVLHRFSPEENQKIENQLPTIVSAIQSFVDNGFEHSATLFNG